MELKNANNQASKLDKSSKLSLKKSFLLSFKQKNLLLDLPYKGNFEIDYVLNDIFLKIENEVIKQKKLHKYNGQVTASGLVDKNGEILIIKTQNVDVLDLLNEVKLSTWNDLAQKLRESFNPPISKSFFSKIVENLPKKMQEEGVCIREGLKKSGIPVITGTGYELCSHCQPDNHSEAQVIYAYLNQFLPKKDQILNQDDFLKVVNLSKSLDEDLKDYSQNNSQKHSVKKAIQVLQNSSLFLYGHWWCCQDCSNKIESVGIKKIFLSKNWVENNLDLISKNAKTFIKTDA